MKKIFLLIFLTAVIQACKKDDAPSSPIAISSISPGEAFAGETVTISGRGFSAIEKDNHVYFNNIEALVSSADAGKLQVIVPQGSGTGKVKVEVDGIFAESETEFVVKQPTGKAPVISGFSPASGAAGASIIITGENFNADAGLNNVLINESVATVTAAETGKLTVRVPQGALTGVITVTIEGRSAASKDVFVVEDPAAQAPQILDFSPLEAISGDEITIRGQHFSAVKEENIVTIGGKSAVVIQATTDMIKAVVPQEAATGSISVKVNGKTANAAQQLTVFHFPVVTSFSPTSGPPGTEITIEGRYFGATPQANTVYLEFMRMQVTYASENMLKFTVPQGAKSGKISISANGITTRSNQAYEVTFVCGVPSGAFAYDGFVTKGAEALILVKCGSLSASNNIITFTGGAIAVPVSAFDASILMGEPGWVMLTITVPAGAQSGPITVTVDGQTSAPSDYIPVLD